MDINFLFLILSPKFHKKESEFTLFLLNLGTSFFTSTECSSVVGNPSPHSDIYHGRSYLGMLVFHLVLCLIFCAPTQPLKEIRQVHCRHQAFVIGALLHKHLEKSFLNNKLLQKCKITCHVPRRSRTCN